ncbi:patellin-4-like [Senna tora]|uniref:Patellin-4-like n=1 Tax=Senna tora TaxID=362788 RepID=A0A834TC13_9FABA|nr:patellin-4-like [Senna tora]
MCPEELRDITLWGVPLLPSKAHEGTDNVLFKFLKAKVFSVSEAFDMLQKTLIWRRDNNINDGILDEEFDSELGESMYLNGRDREGRPVCYSVYGIFKNKELCKRTFGTEERRDKFLRWRIQFMEKAIQKLSFREGGVDSMIHIIDLNHTPRHGMKDLNSISKKTLTLFQNYYPEIIHKNIVVNAPFWFYTSQVLFSKFMTQRSETKFILARAPRATGTLLKFIAPERLPVEYGGLNRENDEDFSPSDKALEHKIKANTVSTIEVPVKEPGVTVIWDVTVVGWEVSYKEEFIPEDEGSYNILLQNQKKMGESIRNSFYINEPGKIVITVGNGTFKKKRMFYRSKTISTVPMFIFLK